MSNKNIIITQHRSSRCSVSMLFLLNLIYRINSPISCVSHIQVLLFKFLSKYCFFFQEKCVFCVRMDKYTEKQDRQAPFRRVNFQSLNTEEQRVRGVCQSRNGVSADVAEVTGLFRDKKERAVYFTKSKGFFFLQKC